MNGRLTWIVVVISGVALFVLSGFPPSPVRADGGHGYGGGGHGHGMERHMGHHGGRHHHMLHHLLRHQKDIDLTDEQAGKLKALALDQDRAKIRAHADVMVAKRELKSLVWDEKTDLSVIQAKLKEQVSLEANERFIEIKGRRELLAVLTPEQRDKLKAMREQMRESHRARALNHDLDRTDGEGTAEGAPPPQETEPYKVSAGQQAG